MKKKLLSILLVGALVPQFSMANVTHGQEGHGGDSYSAEFTAIGDQLVNQISGLPLGEREGVNVAQLAAAVNNTLIESVDIPLVLDGDRPVEAINYPDKSLIEINRQDWDSMTFTRRQLLVLHEYLSVSGVNDENYVISAKVFLGFGEIAPNPNPNPDPTPSSVPTGVPAPVYSGTPMPVYSGAPTPVYSDTPTPVYSGAPTPVYSGAPTPVYSGAPTPVYSGAPGN